MSESGHPIPNRVCTCVDAGYVVASDPNCPRHATRNREAELADALYAAYGRGQRDYSKGRVMSFADVLRTYGDPLLQKWRAT